ncbi:MAG: hypothetical protein ACC726_15280, partial [Chloroflexota bacterium]
MTENIRPGRNARRVGLLTLAGAYALLGPGAAVMATHSSGDVTHGEVAYRRPDSDDDAFLSLDLDDLDDLDEPTLTGDEPTLTGDE